MNFCNPPHEAEKGRRARVQRVYSIWFCVFVTVPTILHISSVAGNELCKRLKVDTGREAGDETSTFPRRPHARGRNQGTGGRSRQWDCVGYRFYKIIEMLVLGLIHLEQEPV